MEGDGFVEVCVVLVEGRLQGQVAILLSTSDASAIRKLQK